MAALQKLHFITREPYKRTQLVRVTPKFFEYFEVSPEELKKKFAQKKLQEEEHQKKLMDTLPSPSGEFLREGEISAQNAETSGAIDQMVQTMVHEELVKQSSEDTLLDGGEIMLTENDVAQAESVNHEEKLAHEGEFEERKETGETNDYEPPKVIGGFEEFTEEEKDAIQEEVKDIIEGDDEEE